MLYNVSVMWPFRRRTDSINTYTLVLQTGSSGTVALVTSLLDSAGIKYWVCNNYVEDLFGLGRLGGLNITTGPVQILVRNADADIAKDLIGNIQEIQDSRLPLAPRIFLVITLMVIPVIIYICATLTHPHR